MLSLRFPKIWSGLGWLFVLGVIVSSLLPGHVVSVVSLNDKIEHGLAYGFLMVWFAGCYRRGLYAAIGGVLVALGIALDLLQGLTRTRTFDWYDILADVIGIVVGGMLAFWLVGGWCQRVEQRLLS